MPLSFEDRLKLASASKKKEKSEKERLAEVIGLVNKTVAENIRHGEDGKDGKDGVTTVVHEYEPLPEDIVKVDDLLSVRKDIEGLLLGLPKGEVGEELKGKIDILISLCQPKDPVPYRFDIVRNEFGQIKEVLALPQE